MTTTQENIADALDALQHLGAELLRKGLIRVPLEDDAILIAPIPQTGWRIYDQHGRTLDVEGEALVERVAALVRGEG